MADYIERKKAIDACFDGWNNNAHDCAENIRLIPAADVRPVVRGKWIGNKRHQSCSECYMTYCVPDGQDGELDMTAYHFCPNCGAKMGES